MKNENAGIKPPEELENRPDNLMPLLKMMMATCNERRVYGGETGRRQGK